MNARALVASITVTLLMMGCVAKTPYPSTWDARTGSGGWCATPTAAFMNSPLHSTAEATDSGEIKLELKEVFFGSALNGFDVTHLSFDYLESGFVLVKPWIGERELKEEVRIDRKHRNCADNAWVVKSDWVALPGAAMAGLLWTGGIVMPMAARATFDLELTKAGDLSVHATLRTSGTTFLVFPMRTRDADEWFLYASWTRVQENTPVTK